MPHHLEPAIPAVAIDGESTTPSTQARTAEPAGRSPAELRIRLARPDERGSLVDIWLRSVRATHAFLRTEDIDALLGPTRAYLTSDKHELWIVADGSDGPVGFMGLAGSEVESLFLAPEVHRRGAGRRLIEHAAALRGELTVVVNEQNVGAVRFYEACNFTVDRRSEVDDEGRPFPILYMRRPTHSPRV